MGLGVWMGDRKGELAMGVPLEGSRAGARIPAEPALARGYRTRTKAARSRRGAAARPPVVIGGPAARISAL